MDIASTKGLARPAILALYTRVAVWYVVPHAATPQWTPSARNSPGGSHPCFQRNPSMSKRRPKRVWWRKLFRGGGATDRDWSWGRGRQHRPGWPRGWGKSFGRGRRRRHCRPFGRGRPFGRRGRFRHGFTLGDLSPGARARIISLKNLPGHARDRLLALGLVPGRRVEVIRQTPVTLVRAEHSELALEAEMADGIIVETETPEE